MLNLPSAITCKLTVHLLYYLRDIRIFHTGLNNLNNSDFKKVRTKTREIRKYIYIYTQTPEHYLRVYINAYTDYNGGVLRDLHGNN